MVSPFIDPFNSEFFDNDDDFFDLDDELLDKDCSSYLDYVFAIFSVSKK